jgi:quercetin dioxygenase-like cupin family protein
MDAKSESEFDPFTPANDSNALELRLVPSNGQTGFVVDVAQTPVEGGTDPTYGEVTWRTLICADKTPTREFVLGVADFKPGEKLHPHRHEPAEFYYCTSGTGKVIIEGVVHNVHQGIAVYVPTNATHSVIAGPNGLSFLYGFAEARFGAIDYQFSNNYKLL